MKHEEWEDRLANAGATAKQSRKSSALLQRLLLLQIALGEGQIAVHPEACVGGLGPRCSFGRWEQRPRARGAAEEEPRIDHERSE